jgi:hypothetical protein
VPEPLGRAASRFAYATGDWRKQLMRRQAAAIIERDWFCWMRELAQELDRRCLLPRRLGEPDDLRPMPASRVNPLSRELGRAGPAIACPVHLRDQVPSDDPGGLSAKDVHLGKADV